MIERFLTEEWIYDEGYNDFIVYNWKQDSYEQLRLSGTSSRWCRHKILSHINTQQIWTDAL